MRVSALREHRFGTCPSGSKSIERDASISLGAHSSEMDEMNAHRGVPFSEIPDKGVFLSQFLLKVSLRTRMIFQVGDATKDVLARIQC